MLRISFCWIILLNILMMNTPVHGQSYDGLQALNGFQTKTFFSNGTEGKAKRMAKQLDSVMAFYAEHLAFRPEVTLLILSPADWPRFTTFPFYGMPHYNSKTLIVAAENNDYWKSMVPAIEKLPSTYAQLIRDTYTDSAGNVSMEAFFDLLAVHELGHAYTQQGGLVTQRKWMGELFPNILLHTYIAEREPSLLKALTVFPEMVVATTDTATLAYTTLQELETNYGQMGPRYPQNYGWYQCRWHVAAGKIYDQGKVEVVKKLWAGLKGQREVLSDAELLVFLGEKGHDSVAGVMTKW